VQRRLVVRPGVLTARQNYKRMTLAVEKVGDSYKNHLEESGVATLLSFVGEKNTFSLFGYELPFKDGHQMAFWSDGSRTRFFDPNFGVMSFLWHSGLNAFLACYLAFSTTGSRRTDNAERPSS
jgi:hypothetical protein